MLLVTKKGVCTRQPAQNHFSNSRFGRLKDNHLSLPEEPRLPVSLDRRGYNQHPASNAPKTRKAARLDEGLNEQIK